MNIIYFISPDYADAILKEVRTKKYNFCVQGYGSAELAAENLQKTNTADILGYFYLSDKLPEDLNYLRKMLRRCNEISRHDNKKFIFALKDITGLDTAIKDLNLSNLVLSYINLDVVTDTLINQDLIGNILLSVFEPYITKDVEKEMYKVHPFPILQYKHTLNTSVLDVFNEVKLLQDAESTLAFDTVYLKYKETSNILRLFREFYIRQYFNEGLDYEQISSKLDVNDSNFTLFSALLLKLKGCDTNAENL